jgi:hypothetical protein
LPPLPSPSRQLLSCELCHEQAPSLHEGSNADMDIENPDFVQDEALPGFYFEELN